MKRRIKQLEMATLTAVLAVLVGGAMGMVLPACGGEEEETVPVESSAAPGISDEEPGIGSLEQGLRVCLPRAYKIFPVGTSCSACVGVPKPYWCGCAVSPKCVQNSNGTLCVCGYPISSPPPGLP